MSKTKPNVYIRGIYSTALTKLFIDAGYPIIFPSKISQTRFNIPSRRAKSYSKDITIRDRLDRQGVSVMFKKDTWNELEKTNFEGFPLSQNEDPNLIILQSRFHKNSIYRGLCINSNKNSGFSFIRLTPEDIQNGKEERSYFQTTLGRYGRFLPEGKEGIFQVTHEDNGKIRASLGSYYTIPGDLIVINPYNNKVIISKEITNGRQKKRLFDLGKSIQLQKKYGYIFRTAAQYATENEILEEVERLDQYLVQTQNTITKFPDRIGEIYSNYRSLNVLFPSSVKTRLDKLRNSIVPTLDYHHVLKSSKPHVFGTRVPEEKTFHKSELTLNLAEIIDYTEDLMNEVHQSNYNALNSRFRKFYFSNIKYRDPFSIYHRKLTGKTINLTSGFVQKIEFDALSPIKVSIKRKFREGGVYDGIGSPIEEGDYAFATYEEGSWFYCTSYYSKNNELKGKYFNINTPISISTDGVGYIDLEIDVVQNMVGEKKIIDLEKLQQAYEMNIISQEVYDKAMNLAENIRDGLIA
jgi:probable ribonuclease FAU-1